MKKFRVGLMAFALTVGIASAFANQSAHRLHSTHQADMWQDTNPDGSVKTVAEGGNTYANESAAITATGCTSGTVDCAASVDGVDGQETGNFILHN